MAGARRPRILISNDDGVSAPGLIALTKELNRQSFCDFYVCGPFGERSAQSHSLSVTSHLHVFEIPIDGAVEAFAVDGTPADSVGVALKSSLLRTRDFDLVVSGINRGDNVGLHVLYSGTVGAAREATCRGYPAIAFSLASHRARSEEDYAQAAGCAVAFIKSMVTMIQSYPDGVSSKFRDYVINVNIPGHDVYNGIRLCYQGKHCSNSELVEIEADPHFVQKNGHKDTEIHMGSVTVRAFKFSNWKFDEDSRYGTDSHAIYDGWVSVTLLGQFSDVPLSAKHASSAFDAALVDHTKVLLTSTGKLLGLKVEVESLF